MDRLQVMRDFVDAQNRHDVEGILRCFAPDFKRKSAETGWEEIGIGNYEDMTLRFWKAFPDVHFEIEALAIDGNRCFLQYQETGTWTGTWEMPGGIVLPPQHNGYTSTAVITCELNEEGLISKYCYYTQNGFVKAYPILNPSNVVVKNEAADQ